MSGSGSALLVLPEKVLARILKLSLMGSSSSLVVADIRLANQCCKAFKKILATFHDAAHNELVDIFDSGKRVITRIRR